MRKNWFILVCMAFLYVSCTNTTKTEKLVIASEQIDCVGVGLQKCLLIKNEGDKDWQYWYSGIEGFNYERGYEYVIEVRKETIDSPAADQSSLKYIFVKEISKKRKASDNMPQMS